MLKFIEFLNENTSKKFTVDGDEFKLILGEDLIAKSEFNVKPPDEWFDEKYVILHDLKTLEEFRGKGTGKNLLFEIFKYVKEVLKINIITLIVYKDNPIAVKLYRGAGFEMFIEYDDSYSLVKRL